MAAVVRDWLFGSAEGERPPSAEVAADVLAKCQLLEATAAATAAATGDAEPASMDEEDGSRVVEPEPYFCPIEYLYLSEPIIQRHHRAAPLTRRENEHFAVGDLSEVAMEPISDTPPAAGAGLPHSSSSGSLRSFQQQGGSFSSAGGGAPPAASHRPQPPPQSLAPQAVSRPRPPLGGPRGAASLLGAAQRLQKPRLKVIKLDDVKVRVLGGWFRGCDGKHTAFLNPHSHPSHPITNHKHNQIQVKTDHAKVAASNEALSLEFGTQPLQLDTKTASKLQQPAQSAAGTAAAAAAFTEAPDAAKKRSAAEALAGLVAPSASSASADAVQAPTAAEAAGAAASMDPLSDYHRMKAKSNRLTPQDDERIRLFYLHGTQGNPHPEQREVKIKINEEEVAKEDGSRVKETLYISLNYDTRKAVLVRTSGARGWACRSALHFFSFGGIATDLASLTNHLLLETIHPPTVTQGQQAQEGRAMSRASSRQYKRNLD